VIRKKPLKSSKTVRGRTRGKAKSRYRVSPPNHGVLVRTLRRHERRLKSLPNVHHLGISEKIKKGRSIPTYCIAVYVTKKGDVPKYQRIPSRLKLAIPGVTRMIRTDVCELPGIPQLFAMRGGARIISSDMETGTAGLVFRHQNRNYCLTNAHVVSDPEQSGTQTVVVAPPVGGNGQVVLRDALSSSAEITSDAALVLLDTAVDSWRFYNLEKIVSDFADNLSIGQICEYVARSGAQHKTYQCKLVAMVSGSAQIEVDGTFLTYRDFYRFEVLNGSPVGGHSGALLYQQGNESVLAAGLAFGGIKGSEIWAFPARRCYDKMMAYFSS
jgi:hypothetical protein